MVHYFWDTQYNIYIELLDLVLINNCSSGALVQEVDLPPGSIVGYSGRNIDNFVSYIMSQISQTKIGLI